ncbi:MAG: S8 family peptidase [Blastocatellia bacterium]
MAQRTSQPLRHFLFTNQARTEKYTRPGGGSDKFSFLLRSDRQKHGEMLRDQLEEVARKSQAQQQAVQAVEKGFYVEFEGEPGHDLKVESLKDKKAGIKLVAVTEIERDETTQKLTRAMVFVPEGKISHFIKKVEEYLDPAKKTPKLKPKNQKLIESISNIRLATLRSLWTEAEPFPLPDELLWWEIWLRTDGTPEENLEVVQVVREQAAQAQLTISESELAFPDTTVLLLRATAAQLTQSVYLLNALAEVRRAKETAEFFINLNDSEEREWVEEANNRIIPPPTDAPAVCLLDTGVNWEHPLLQHGLRLADMDAYKKAWGVSDHHPQGHGTGMAGLSLYGDLTKLFLSNEPVLLQHRLESVKLVPPTGKNDPPLYGAITTECMARAEVFAPERPRTYALMTCAKDDRDRGRPSSWSAALDQYMSGAQEEDQSRRLIVIAAGNADDKAPGNYPDKNLTDEIHDPGQAWNALTVGAYTEKVRLGANALPGWMPLAPNGGLCPRSTTSCNWAANWPFKPDIVFEGGNLARHPDESGLWELDSLRLLTTYSNWQQHLLALTGDTSAATALAARMCAQVMAEYPQFWPETVRGLLVNTAEWTPAMLPFDLWSAPQRQIQTLLRTYGYGVPRLEKALHSARNSLTLIAQDEIQPFYLAGSEVKTNEMKLHELPWPRAALQSLGETLVEMRVTLSYFIEPKPQRNERNAKHPPSYRSHGLHFDVKRPAESAERFLKRINQVMRDENFLHTSTSKDTENWGIGTQLRRRGSLHSDIWKGTAADLADKGQLAVFPVSGWWRNLRSKQKYDHRTRYSLIVTIKTPDVGVDLYEAIRVSIPV